MLQAFNVIVVNPTLSTESVQFADRGLQYGDGCFTTMYCEGNTVSLFNEHILRLVTDAARLKMFVDMDKIKQAVEPALRAQISSNKSSLAIKLMLTRGAGGRGYEVPQDPTLHLYISFHACEKFEQFASSNYRVQTCSFPLAQQAMLAGVKHINRLEQVLAKHELQHLPSNIQINDDCNSSQRQRIQVHDLLMLDGAHHVIEFTAGNLFFLHAGIWHTPNLNLSGVDGVMRQTFLKFLKAKNIEHAIGQYTVNDLLAAESLLMCNAIKHLVGVSELLPAEGEFFQPKLFSMQPVKAVAEGFRHYLHSRKSTFEKLESN